MLNKKNYLKNHDDLFYDFIKFVTYLKYFKTGFLQTSFVKEILQHAFQVTSFIIKKKKYHS